MRQRKECNAGLKVTNKEERKQKKSETKRKANN